MPTNLNQRAWQLCDQLAANAEMLRAIVSHVAGMRVIDCGVKQPGGLEAGQRLAEICLAGLGRVAIESGPQVVVQTDQPLLACMASQYAGWQITGEKYFAMGSGPMRAVARREPLFEHLGVAEQATRVVGVLETSKLPTEEVCRKIADQCGVTPENVTLLVARTASIAGTVQVVARSVETALHKLHELGYDLKKVVCGFGAAPLPPVAADDLVGIGRTNDAILYGGEVTLWVQDDDVRLAEIGPKIPSCASRDFGDPFAAIFERAGRDFYKIDPLLFSPAVVTLMNLTTGKSHRFGELRPESWYARDLARAAGADHEVVTLPFSGVSAEIAANGSAKVICGDCDLAEFDAVIVRTMPPGSLEQVVFRMDCLGRYEAAGGVVINPARAVEAAVDKFLTSAKLAAGGLLTPRTVCCQTPDEALTAFEQLGGDVVLKPLFGSEGRGITRLNDEALAERAFRMLTQLGAVLYLQEFIPHEGCDLRLLVIGERILAMRRRNPLDWRTNISRGAKPEPLSPDDALVAIARQAAAAVGAPVAGVDLLPGRDGRIYTIEVNAVPGWKGLGRVLNEDVARIVLDFVAGEVRRVRG